MSSWRPTPAIARAIVIEPHLKPQGDDLPLDLGDEVYIVEQGGVTGEWSRGYLAAQPSILSGLTPSRGGRLEQRIYSGTFPLRCVKIEEVITEETLNSSYDSEGNGAGRLSDSVREMCEAIREKENFQFKQKMLEQMETNTLPIPERNAQDEKPQAPVPLLQARELDYQNLSEPLVDEIKSSLTEWQDIGYHKLILANGYTGTEEIDKLVEFLFTARQQLQLNVLSARELEILRHKAIWAMNKGNKILSGEIIVRSEEKLGSMMDAEDCAIDLSAMQAITSLLDEPPMPHTAEEPLLHHLLVDVKTFINASNDPTTLVFNLVTRTGKGGEPVTMTENFAVDLQAQGSLESLNTKLRIATLFGDMTSADIGDMASGDTKVFLIVRALRTFVPLQLNSADARNSATVSREHLATPFHAANSATINSNKGSVRRSMLMGTVRGSVKNVFKSPSKAPSKSPYKLGSLNEAFEPPNTGEPRLSTASSMTPPGTPGKAVQRLVAIGAVHLTQIMKQHAKVDAKVQLWIPSPAFDPMPENKGSDWNEILRDLMVSKIGSYKRMSTLPKIELILKPYTAEDAASLISNKPTELSGVPITPKIGFSGAPTKARNDVYITVDKATFPKNAVLSRATGGNTALSQRTEFNNLQVRLEVRDHKGATIANAIHISSNGQGVSAYDTTVTGKNDTWNETIRINISPEDVKGAHLVMLTSDAPNHAFAVSHLPLWQENVFVRDGNHDLLMYKNEEGMSSALPDSNRRGGYLTVPWEAKRRDGISRDEALTGPLSTLRIKTYLCSTRMSQDKTIFGLLNWKSQEQADVADTLRQLLFCPEIEVVKQLSEVFDALFAILVQHSENETFEDLVFMAIVHVLGIVYDRRFNLSPLVDQYAEERFNFPSATPCLIKSFVRLLVATDPASAKKLRTTFKVTKHILKFITQGRSQQIEKQADIGITNGSAGFANDLATFFKALNTMMNGKEPHLVGSQTLAAQHFANWLPELTSIMKPEAIVHCAIDFIDAMRDVKGKLVLYKLVLITKIPELDIFSKEKGPLLHNTVRWLKSHWGANEDTSPQYREQVRLCCTILSTQIKDLASSNLLEDHLPNVIESYLKLITSSRSLRNNNFFLLWPKTYPFPVKMIENKKDNFDEALIELAAIFSEISNSDHGLQLEQIADSKEDLSDLVYKTLKMQESILNAEAFPKNWLSVYVYHHRSAMQTLDQLGQVLLTHLLPSPEEFENGVPFLDALWKLFFSTLIKILTSEALTLETFAQQKRRAVWNIAGDVRTDGAKVLKKVWHALGWDIDEDDQRRYGLAKMGGYQVQFESLIPATLELCLHVHVDLQATGTEMLKSMIASDWELNESLTGIQSRIIDSLDGLFRTKPFVDVQNQFLIDLLDHFQSCFVGKDDTKRVEIEDMINLINDFLQLLEAAYAKDMNEADQLIHRLALMKFFESIDKTDTFIKYVHQLATVQVAAGNFTEAGLALRKHAELYPWNSSATLPIMKEPHFPSQKVVERKESIFFEMIRLFEEGLAWGSALECYEELSEYYASIVFDFKKLARTQKSMGNVFEQIANSDRPLTKFFYIVFGGFGFQNMREKEFISESKPGEDIAAFGDRLQELYPDARIVDDLMDFADIEGKFVSIKSTYPLVNLTEDFFQRPKVPAAVKDFLATRDCNKFWIPLEKERSGPVQNHSSKKIVFTVEETFPTISRRSAVIDTDVLQLNAIETAIERVHKATRVVTAYEKRWVQRGDDMSLNELVKLLSHEVEPQPSAVVNTRVLIPVPTGDDAFDTLSTHECVLKTALIDLAISITRSLSKLELSDNSTARASAVPLREQFEKTFATEVAIFAPKVVEDADETQNSAFSLSILTSGDLIAMRKPAMDNRASNLSTLGPLPSMNMKATQQPFGKSFTSTRDDDVSIKTQSSKRDRLSGFFKSGSFNHDDSVVEVSSMMRLNSTMKKPKRAPPVSFNNGSNANATATKSQGLKRRDSDVGSAKSSRRSIGSFSKPSFFGRDRANSNATQQTQEAVTDDGNSEWVSEAPSGPAQYFDQNLGRHVNKRFASDSTNNDSLEFQDPRSRTMFMGPNRHISDSILRGASTTQGSIIASISQFNEAPSPLNTFANTMLQGRGGAGRFEHDDNDSDIDGPEMDSLQVNRRRPNLTEPFPQMQQTQSAILGSWDVPARERQPDKHEDASPLSDHETSVERRRHMAQLPQDMSADALEYRAAEMKAAIEQKESDEEALRQEIERECRDHNLPWRIVNFCPGKNFEEKLRFYNEQNERDGIDVTAEFRKPPHERAPLGVFTPDRWFINPWDGRMMRQTSYGQITIDQQRALEEELAEAGTRAEAWADDRAEVDSHSEMEIRTVIESPPNAQRADSPMGHPNSPPIMESEQRFPPSYGPHMAQQYPDSDQEENTTLLQDRRDISPRRPPPGLAMRFVQPVMGPPPPPAFGYATMHGQSPVRPPPGFGYETYHGPSPMRTPQGLGFMTDFPGLSYQGQGGSLQSYPGQGGAFQQSSQQRLVMDPGFFGATSPAGYASPMGYGNQMHAQQQPQMQHIALQDRRLNSPMGPPQGYQQSTLRPPPGFGYVNEQPSPMYQAQMGYGSMGPQQSPGGYLPQQLPYGDASPPMHQSPMRYPQQQSPYGGGGPAPSPMHQSPMGYPNLGYAHSPYHGYATMRPNMMQTQYPMQPPPGAIRAPGQDNPLFYQNLFGQNMMSNPSGYNTISHGVRLQFATTPYASSPLASSPMRPRGEGEAPNGGVALAGAGELGGSMRASRLRIHRRTSDGGLPLDDEFLEEAEDTIKKSRFGSLRHRVSLLGLFGVKKGNDKESGDPTKK